MNNHSIQFNNASDIRPHLHVIPQDDDREHLYLAGQLMKHLQDLGLNKAIGQITVGDLLKISKELNHARY
jgi:hypothetical protein